MVNRNAAIAIACLISMQSIAGAAHADNQMGYQLLTPQQASVLPRNGGKLGMEVGRAQQVNSGGMTFDILRVKGVTASSPAAQAGFKVGDQIIAVDGRVFPSVATFAAYVGSLPPARQISVDYMPPTGGPEDAQRVNVTVGGGVAPAVVQPAKPEEKGMSTGTKVAIGVAAAALFGCYKLGCFSHRTHPVGVPQPAR